MTAEEALANLEATTEETGAPTLHINRQMLRQYLEPIQAALTADARELAKPHPWEMFE